MDIFTDVIDAIARCLALSMPGWPAQHEGQPGAVPTELLAGQRPLRLYHQFPRVLHRAGRQQPGRRVPAAPEQDHRRL